MKFEQISKNIYYLPQIKEKDYPNLGYIKGDNYSIMVDAGASYKHVNSYNKALRELGFIMPSFTILTHSHWDHTFGMSALDAKTIVHKKTNEKLEEMSKWSWNIEDMNYRLSNNIDIPFAHDNILKEFDDLSSIKILKGDIEFEDNLKFDLGNLVVEIFHTEAPHSNDSVLIYVPKDKVLFLGDSISKDYYNNMYYDLEKLNILIKNLESIDFEIGILGHNDPIKKEDLINILKSFL